MDRILAAFDMPDPPRAGRPPRLAAVLLALFDGPEGPSLLYIRRAEGMRSHPGEISFPGGRVDPGDAGPLQAALREAQEEVGLDPKRVERVGHLTDYVTYRGGTVCAYVGRVAGEAPREPASLEEVADVFLVPVARLLDEGVYEARRLAGMEDDRRVHYWRVQPQTIWGITGELTARFLQRACGWTPPLEVRTIDEVEQFLPDA